MVKMEWFEESQIPHERVTIEEVEDILSEAHTNPTRAWNRMMEQIDIALDNKDAEEFYALSGLLCYIP